jgi:hypothetical protein
MIILLLVVVTVLTLPAPMQAWAECAWVLWTHVTSPSTAEWQTDSAFDNKSACEERLRTRLTAARERNGIVTGTMAIFEKFNMVHIYRCLPDSIDPRGPKR